MPEENSIFMKTSSRALGILTQLHSETAQAMYAYTVGRQQEANEMALSNAILAERLIGCYRVIPSLLGSPHARKNIFFAERIVSIPIVSAWKGTYSTPKNSDAAETLEE